MNSETAITSDSGLYRLMASKGLNVLKISPYDIELYNMSGFIGGASGLLYDNLLAFNGDLSTHRDHKNIEDFCRNVGVDTVSLSHGILKDIGSIISL